MELILTALMVAPYASAVPSQANSMITDYLAESSRAPANYVAAVAKAHRITVIGEAHWLQADVDLVQAIIPVLHDAGIDLAVEAFPASEQSKIGELISVATWDDRQANEIMRAADWPYEEYRDLLHAAWSANRGSERPLSVVGLGPPTNWRDVLLPHGVTYDAFMADLVARHVDQTQKKVVVYCGMHHAFTRYYMADLDDAGKTRAYMDRMGNILSRKFGEQVFLIALHKPIWCGNPAQPSYCLPCDGLIDCAGVKIGRPIGFDIIGSPLAELRFKSDDYYAYGHPYLRFVDYADGYVVSGPIESARLTTVIPLAEYCPDNESLAQTAHANPFNDEVDVSLDRLREIWAAELEANRDVITKRKWNALVGWRSKCNE